MQLKTNFEGKGINTLLFKNQACEPFVFHIYSAFTL